MATATVTPDQNAVIAEVFIAAPPARVFQAISDPTQLPRWWGQDGLYHVTKSTMDGEYLEVDPPRLLVHTWVSSYDTAKTVVRWELEPQTMNSLHPSGPKKSGTGTLVRVTQEGFAGNFESAKAHGEGWKRVLGWLEAFLLRELN